MISTFVRVSVDILQYGVVEKPQILNHIGRVATDSSTYRTKTRLEPTSEIQR